MKINNLCENYEAPQVEIIEVAVEKGFATSAADISTNIESLTSVNW